jgi:hypothetical protein
VRDVKDRFGVARCCCGTCTDCCSGYAPAEYDVDIQQDDESCSVCDSLLSGVFTIPRVSNFGGSAVCDWSQIFAYPLPLGPVFDCNEDYAYVYDKYDLHVLTLKIRCVVGDKYSIQLTQQITRRYGQFRTETWTGATPNVVYKTGIGYYNDVAYWTALVNFTDFQCDEANEFELSLARVNGSRSFALYDDAGFPILPPPNSNPNFSFDYTGAPGSVNNWMVKYICDYPATVKITAVP